jgi:hypothetical protein
MSIVEIVEAGTLHRRVAALLWLLLERKRSIILASEPPMSGKTTTLSALLPFLPGGTRLVFLRGLSETFDYLKDGDPERAYLLVNELSSHLPVYLWGRKAAHMFRTLEHGYGLGTTMHADDVEGVLSQLRSELGLGTAEIGRLDVIGIMRLLHGRTPIVGHDDLPPELRYGKDSVRRRLVALHLVVSRSDGVDTPLLCAWDPSTDQYTLTLDTVLPELARRAGRTVEEFCRALAERESFLGDLSARGVRRPMEVRDAIAAYRGEDPLEVRE